MTGKIIQYGSATPPKHWCESGIPPKHEYLQGTIWRCECGRYYELTSKLGLGSHAGRRGWYRVSKRRVWWALKRAEKAQGLT